MSLGLEQWEIDEWKAACDRHRRRARAWPCFFQADIQNDRYGFRLGPWHVRAYLRKRDHRDPGMWTASAAILEEVGYERITITPPGKGALKAPEASIEIPQDALLSTESWNDEHFRQARALLGDLLAPEILHKEQPVQEFKGLWSVAWITPNQKEMS